MDFKSQTPNSEFLTEDQEKLFLGTAYHRKVQGI